MELKFYDIFRFITVFLFLFTAFILIKLKRGNKLSNRLFAIFLFSKVFCFTDSLIFRFGANVAAWSPHVFNIGESFEFLLGPSLLLYSQSLAYRDFSLKIRHILHLFPFFFHLIFMSYKYHFHAVETKIQFLREGFLSSFEYNLNVISINLHFIIYSIAILIILNNYRKALKQYYSSIGKIQLSWLSLLVGGFIVLWSTSLINYLGMLAGNPSFFPKDLSIVMLFVFANMILYKGIVHHEIFGGIERPKLKAKPLISETICKRYIEKLKTFMKNEKPYLDPSLSLNNLAEQLSIPPRHLSQVINDSLNKNFFDLVSDYRINETKQMLKDPTNKKKTILEILYDAGFNSKSSFNFLFKKKVGITPSEFRKNSLQNGSV